MKTTGVCGGAGASRPRDGLYARCDVSVSTNTPTHDDTGVLLSWRLRPPRLDASCISRCILPLPAHTPPHPHTSAHASLPPLKPGVPGPGLCVTHPSPQPLHLCTCSQQGQPATQPCPRKPQRLVFLINTWRWSPPLRGQASRAELKLFCVKRTRQDLVLHVGMALP